VLLLVQQQQQQSWQQWQQQQQREQRRQQLERAQELEEAIAAVLLLARAVPTAQQQPLVGWVLAAIWQDPTGLVAAVCIALVGSVAGLPQRQLVAAVAASLVLAPGGAYTTPAWRMSHVAQLARAVPAELHHQLVQTVIAAMQRTALLATECFALVDIVVGQPQLQQQLVAAVTAALAAMTQGMISLSADGPPLHRLRVAEVARGRSWTRSTCRAWCARRSIVHLCAPWGRATLP
jgi:hypothetical protein